MPKDLSSSPLDNALRLFRRVMPGVQGVVLASHHDGSPLAHDLDHDPAPVAARAHRERTDLGVGASHLVPHGASTYLVVFVPHPPRAAEGFSTEAPLTASCPAQTETWSPAAIP